MSQRQILVLIGVAIIILPVLGFPMFWKQILLALVGLGLIFFAFRGGWRHSPIADTFSDSHNQTV